MYSMCIALIACIVLICILFFQFSLFLLSCIRVYVLFCYLMLEKKVEEIKIIHTCSNSVKQRILQNTSLNHIILFLNIKIKRDKQKMYVIIMPTLNCTIEK